jgi:hypothetical protein
MVANSGNASLGRPSGRVSSEEKKARASLAAFSRAQRERAEAGFIPAQAHQALSMHREEEGGSRGKHGFLRASSAGRVAGRLNAPRPALVEVGFDGTPRIVNRELVALVREEWRVVDRWWTEEPVDRRYFEVVLESGQNVCVYRDQAASCWFTQNA